MSRSAEVDEVVAPLAEDLRSALGDRLVGLYLYGSAVSGGFTPGVSDVDLAAVVSGPVEDLDLALLSSVHDRFVERDPPWRDRLEIVYVSRRSLAQPSNRDAVAVISPGEPFHITGPSSDWLGNWYLVSQTGVALLGPPPTEMIAPISDDDFLSAVRRYLDYLVTSDYVGYAVLSACRAVRTLATGSHCSKEEGAAWVRERLPDWAWVIDAAIEDRLSPGTGYSDGPSRVAAREFVALLASGRFAVGPTSRDQRNRR
ncbi:N/A [soil metagenome]